MTDIKQITTVGDGLLVRAPAKINLSLLIAGKRPDGFHEIETLMAKVNWFDEVFIQKGTGPGIELLCKGPFWAPSGKENLVYRACELLLNFCHIRANIKISLTKNIPAGSGLGSASSDAAATLVGVNRFFKLEVSRHRLKKIAEALGSDVAFFLNGPLALCAGKGEKVKKLDEFFNFSALIILPDVSVSTKTVYANYRHDQGLYQKLSRGINEYVRKNRIDLVSRMCANMLRESCFQVYKELAGLKCEIESLGFRPLCLSGSGSAMFYILRDTTEEKVLESKNKLEQNVGCKSIVVSDNRW